MLTYSVSESVLFREPLTVNREEQNGNTQEGALGSGCVLLCFLTGPTPQAESVIILASWDWNTIP